MRLWKAGSLRSCRYGRCSEPGNRNKGGTAVEIAGMEETFSFAAFEKDEKENEVICDMEQSGQDLLWYGSWKVMDYQTFQAGLYG